MTRVPRPHGPNPPPAVRHDHQRHVITNTGSTP